MDVDDEGVEVLFDAENSPSATRNIESKHTDDTLRSDFVGLFAVKKIVRRQKRKREETKPLKLEAIERVVPPNVLLVFFSAFLVQVPTVLQVIGSYADRKWGNSKYSTTRILCSISVRFSSPMAKRAGVKWASAILRSQQNMMEHEKLRLIRSWNNAVKQAQMSEKMHMKREKEAKRSEAKGKLLLKEKLKKCYEDGRNDEENRLKTLRKIIRTYPDLVVSDHFRKRSVTEVFAEGVKRFDEIDKKDTVAAVRARRLEGQKKEHNVGKMLSKFEPLGMDHDLPEDEQNSVKRVMEKIHVRSGGRKFLNQFRLRKERREALKNGDVNNELVESMEDLATSPVRQRSAYTTPIKPPAKTSAALTYPPRKQTMVSRRSSP